MGHLPEHRVLQTISQRQRERWANIWFSYVFTFPLPRLGENLLHLLQRQQCGWQWSMANSTVINHMRADCQCQHAVWCYQLNTEWISPAVYRSAVKLPCQSGQTKCWFCCRPTEICRLLNWLNDAVYIYCHYCSEPVHCTILGLPVTLYLHNSHRTCHSAK